jgi:serine/threonine protein kinase
MLSLKRQIHVMKLLSSDAQQHPNITKLYEIYHTDSEILFRLEDGGAQSLHKRLVLRDSNKEPFLGPRKATTIIQQCVSALTHMHLLEVAHRDLKPENIIVSETPMDVKIKVTDFDTASVISPGVTSRNTVGTFPFIAPEVVLKHSYDPLPADIWSLGIVFLEVTCCVHVLEFQPYTMAPRRTARRLRQQRYVETIALMGIKACFEDPVHLDMLLERNIQPDLRRLLDKCKTLQRGMLHVAAAQRWTASDLKNPTKNQFLGPVSNSSQSA